MRPAGHVCHPALWAVTPRNVRVRRPGGDESRRALYVGTSESVLVLYERSCEVGTVCGPHRRRPQLTPQRLFSHLVTIATCRHRHINTPQSISGVGPPRKQNKNISGPAGPDEETGEKCIKSDFCAERW